ncbi:hypothetical protein HYQ46_001176 [Verticillium longisporum]|nr:hypothetical protein HYQ46_001176 [Verticillium longisporum]
MGIFSFRRNKDKKKDAIGVPWGPSYPNGENGLDAKSRAPLFPPTRFSARLIAELPSNVLERIFVAGSCPLCTGLQAMACRRQEGSIPQHSD